MRPFPSARPAGAGARARWEARHARPAAGYARRRFDRRGEGGMADTFPKSSIGTEAAHRIIAAAETKASEIGTPMVIAVVDDGGVLKAFSRMDGAALLSVQVAQDKAYTAVGFAMPTHGWHDFIKDDPPLADGAPTGIDRLVIFGGGYPITIDGQLAGAIGVSGGHYSEDQQVAEAGVAGTRAPGGRPSG